MSKIIFVKNAEEMQKWNFEVFKAKPLDRTEDGSAIQADDGEMDDIQMRKSQDIEQAIRCLRLTHDGKYIACGDWYGNIRIHDLQKESLEETHCIEAHDNEVLSIDYTRQINKNSKENAAEDLTAGYLLASGSRDHLI